MSNSLKKALRNPFLAEKVNRATGLTLDKRKQLIETSLPDWDSWCDEASDIRERALKMLFDSLETFKSSVEKRGGTVHVVENESQAISLVKKELESCKGFPVVKSKSMFTEEIRLREALQMEGHDVVETDLGEFIVQVLDQTPSHITAPAIHLSREDIGEVFHRVLNGPDTTDPAELTLFARKILREKFLNARAGLTGANFLVAESGTVVLLENEANIRLTTTLPGKVITLAGIEKLIPETVNLKPLLKVLPVSATAQRQNCYTSFIPAGPRHTVIIMTGWRDRVLKNGDFREAMKCIKCGACLNVCPVFRVVGGHAYDSVYPGPIGAVLSPFMSRTYAHLPYLSSLCGACGEICPVRIPLHRKLLKHRAASGKPWWERTLMAGFATMAPPARFQFSLGLMRKTPGWLRKLLMRPWTKNRGPFPVSGKSFEDLWKKRRGNRP